MKQETRYLISDAARKVAVESHVLRYWEEELKLPIKRNELGHRYYTEDDILRFQEVKALKEQGLQLKAIRMVLKDGRLAPFNGFEKADNADRDVNKAIDKAVDKIADKTTDKEETDHTGESKDTFFEENGGSLREKEPKRILMVNSNEIMSVPSGEPAVNESKEAKSLRLQQLLQHMIAEAVQTNNRELCDEIKETMLKELDYQFRLQEEREEERTKNQIIRDENHYQRIDELLRNRNRKGKREEEGKKGLFRKS